ncbi:MAG: ATP-binding protein [bacterium]
MNKVYDVIYEKAKGYCRDNCDLLHLKNALDMAKGLVTKEGGDETIILPGIILHDVGWHTFSFEEEKRIRIPLITANLRTRGYSLQNGVLIHRHEVEGGAIAEKILTELDYPEDKRIKIIEIILGHDTRTQAISKEDMLVKDADKLSRYTKEGFSSLCEKFNLNEDDFFNYIRFKIEKWFFTSSAKDMARECLLKRQLKISELAWEGGMRSRFFELLIRLESEVGNIAKEQGQKILIEVLRQTVYNLKKAIENYLSLVPNPTLKCLQEDEGFRSLVSPGVGRTGYIGIIDRNTGSIIFHPDQEVINLPLAELKERKRPSQYLYGFWDGFNRTLRGEEFYSTYQGMNEYNEITDKLWYVVPVDIRGFKWALVGAGVCDDFFEPVDILSRDVLQPISQVANQFHHLLDLVDQQRQGLERLNERLKQEIIEHQKTARRLIAAERLSAISQIAAEAAHEIKNPLSVVKTGVYYLSSICKEEKIKKTLSQMDKAIERAASYLNNLLSFSRPPILKTTQVDINEVITETLGELPEEAKAGVEIEKDLAPGLPSISADSGQLKVVFLNFIKNAIESMKEEKRLGISTKEAEEEGARFVQIKFKDSGVGIPAEDIERIFDPFYTTKSKGTGLGLAICKRIIDSHQGRIEVKSKQGEGTTFTIKLSI